MSTPQLVQLFDLLKAADQLAVYDKCVDHWDLAEDAVTYRLACGGRSYLLEDQLVLLDLEGCCLVDTTSNESISLTAEITRPVTPDDVFAAVQANSIS